MSNFQIGDVPTVINKESNYFGLYGRVVEVDNGWYKLHFTEDVDNPDYSAELWFKGDELRP